MAIKLKVIKSKSFEVTGKSHTHYTVAYKGRVFGVSTLRWEGEDLKEDNGVLTIGDCEVIKRVNTDTITGEVSTYLDLVPKLDVILAGI
jgi:hypothetical protein